MRTTIDLPEDLHRAMTAIARDRGTSISETVALLLRRALGASDTTSLETSERTGLPVLRLGRVITSEDVRSLDDDG